MEIHLDPLGGWSGDMFVAAMLDAFPEFWPTVEEAVASLQLGPEPLCRLVHHRDAALTGRRFLVAAEGGGMLDDMSEGAGDVGRHERGQEHDHHTHGHDKHGKHRKHDKHDDSAHEASHGAHPHRAWAAIREQLAGSAFAAETKDRAIAIFTLLAEAEGRVHGVKADDVNFHEVGAVDSIVDIVAAAQLIVLAGATAWSSAPLPLGSGRVRTAHGVLPVPAPATALLLEGLSTIEDGIPGERVTPTGAAIARHLLTGGAAREARPRRLTRSGTGFGTRVLPGISNCLRVLTFEPAQQRAAAGPFGHRELVVIAFEIDDQSAEDLAAGLDHIRALPGIHDVVQSVVFGKKGRLATQVQVLAAPHRLDEAVAACFEETTTIGLRYHLVNGAALARSSEEVEIDGRPLRVKAVERPGGLATAKAEAADVAAARGHALRFGLRREAEAVALLRRARSAKIPDPEGRHDEP